MSKNQWRTLALSLIAIIITLTSIVFSTLMSASAISPPNKKLIAQVTSVTQLQDVDPTADYYQALQSLVERYGSYAGDPDGYMRPEREMTRGETIVTLNASLDRINELIAVATADLVTKQDIATVQNLIEVLSKELQVIRQPKGLPIKAP
ncbi:S-layer homology domain-containing protein [Calothrix sp. FACHB-156]|nr:S-layer homology domain-containing protein [Calothrix sp. FACHB-156]